VKTERGTLVFLTLALAYFARTVFVPLFVALFLAMLLDPMVVALTRLRLNRPVAAILITVSFLSVTVLAGWILYLSIYGVASEVPLYAERIRQILSEVRNFGPHSILGEVGIPQVQIVENVPLWMRYLGGWLGSIYELIAVAIFVPLFLLYILFERDNLLESFNAVAGKFFYLPKLNSDLPKIIRAFARGNVLTGIVLVTLHAFIFRAVGLENWLALAVLSGFINLIPLVGAPLALVLPMAQAMLQFHEVSPFVAIGASLIGLHFLSNNVLLPFFMSQRVNVNSFALVFGLLFWGWLWGPVGFLLAIPMTALVKTLLESHRETFPWSNLFAARPRHLMPGRARHAKPLARADADDLEAVHVDESQVRQFQTRDDR
jgi:predicted PurR-regulated permease PerM